LYKSLSLGGLGSDTAPYGNSHHHHHHPCFSNAALTSLTKPCQSLSLLLDEFISSSVWR